MITEKQQPLILLFSILFLLMLTILPAIAEEMTYNRTVDGDTVVMTSKMGQPVNCRLAYVDTPESANNAKARVDSVRCKVSVPTIVVQGYTAKKFTQTYMSLHPVQDVKVNSVDRYGRYVCEIGNLNIVLIQQGFAVPYLTYIKKADRPKFIKLKDEAKANYVGLWKSSPTLMECMSTK
jgi:endonuclease YncB( thermonuclease family)